MARAENKTASKKYRKVSILNWMGTLVLCSIPGVNIIALILFIIFAKAQAKRSFAIAMLLLSILVLAIICAAFIIFGAEIAQFAESLRAASPVLTVIQQ